MPADEIRENKYDLSVSKYQKVVYVAETYEQPEDIIEALKVLESEIIANLDELGQMVR